MASNVIHKVYLRLEPVVNKNSLLHYVQKKHSLGVVESMHMQVFDDLGTMTGFQSPEESAAVAWVVRLLINLVVEGL